MTQRFEVLNSWKEISNYIGRGVRTVQRWEKDFGLPVRRPCGHLRGSVFALKSEVDAWLSECRARKITLENAPEAVDSGIKIVPAALERLHRNASALNVGFEQLKRNAECLEQNMLRVQQLRERLRAASRVGLTG